MDEKANFCAESKEENSLDNACQSPSKQQQNEQEGSFIANTGDLMSQVISAAFDDLVKEEEDRAHQAEALLGGSLDLVCTYPEGYMGRQPLYSCMTCFAKSGQLAGICYGCSENCHENHELIELYTKRNFCCDCGNSKFKELQCKLFEEKDQLNSRNQYNDNFRGIFCSCKKPYPPPLLDESEGTGTAEQEEDMIQCPVCEDWYHPTHALSETDERSKLDRDRNEQFDLICLPCVQKHPWLAIYQHLEKINGPEDGADAECKLEKLMSKAVEPEGVCLEVGWREKLCRCEKCMARYEDSDCLFLLNREDTIDNFEQQNRERMIKKLEPQPDFEQQQQFVTQVTSEIETMQRHCIDFFAQRGHDGAAITKEDVDECFQELAAKRQRMSVEDPGENDAPWTQ